MSPVGGTVLCWNSKPHDKSNKKDGNVDVPSMHSWTVTERTNFTCDFRIYSFNHISSFFSLCKKVQKKTTSTALCDVLSDYHLIADYRIRPYLLVDVIS